MYKAILLLAFIFLTSCNQDSKYDWICTFDYTIDGKLENDMDEFATQSPTKNYCEENQEWADMDERIEYLSCSCYRIPE